MRPDNYIDVSKIKRPQRKSVPGEVKKVVRRFHDQHFGSIHVLNVLRDDPWCKNKKSLGSNVRAALKYMVKKGELILVTQGKSGLHNKPNVYKAVDRSRK